MEKSKITIQTNQIESREWLNSRIIECGKIVGLSVGNDPSGWDNLIQFVQNREEINSIREGDRSKKKVVRELLSLKKID